MGACVCSSFAISIHALRGEGDDDMIYSKEEMNISIHALRGEGDIFESE